MRCRPVPGLAALLLVAAATAATAGPPSALQNAPEPLTSSPQTGPKPGQWERSQALRQRIAREREAVQAADVELARCRGGAEAPEGATGPAAACRGIMERRDAARERLAAARAELVSLQTSGAAGANAP